MADYSEAVTAAAEAMVELDKHLGILAQPLSDKHARELAATALAAAAPLIARDTAEKIAAEIESKATAPWLPIVTDPRSAAYHHGASIARSAATEGEQR